MRTQPQPFARRIGELEAELADVSAAIAAASRRGGKGPSPDAWKRQLALRRQIDALIIARAELQEINHRQSPTSTQQEPHP